MSTTETPVVVTAEAAAQLSVDNTNMQLQIAELRVWLRRLQEEFAAMKAQLSKPDDGDWWKTGDGGNPDA